MVGGAGSGLCHPLPSKKQEEVPHWMAFTFSCQAVDLAF